MNTSGRPFWLGGSGRGALHSWYRRRDVASDLDVDSTRNGQPPRASALYWLCQALGWSVFCLYVTAGYLYGTGGNFDGRSLFNIALFTLILAPACSHGLRWWIRRHHWIELPPASRLPRAVGTVLLLATLLTTLTAISLVLLFGPPWLPLPVFLSMTVSYSLALGGWCAIYFAVLGNRRHGAVTEATRAAQLQQLKSQLNPHFLFNCLNSVRALIAEDPHRAAVMVTSLADLLRYSLDSDRQHTVTLDDELKVVDEYIKLERMRFEDRLHVGSTVDDLVRSVRVPPMLVQTLVENAVKHGISNAVAGGRIDLRATRDDGHVQIVVTNTGEYQPRTGGGGLGLHNARERLRLLYGDQASLVVDGRGPETVATVRVPLEHAS